MGTPRKLVVDGVGFRWTRSHTHIDIDGKRHCTERFVAWLDGQRGGALRIIFIDSEGGIAEGGGPDGHNGAVAVAGVYYNLNRPAVAAGLIRAALAAGWQPESKRAVEFRDGFTLLARVSVPDEWPPR